ncbi:unnamed protein product [Ectocarpus sp. CCAP 1310/34]|nr:unnamed protein product [Ectocarpus sp. CCAP 1310/34]
MIYSATIMVTAKKKTEIGTKLGGNFDHVV